MVCDICGKKEATVHYTEIVHNQMIKMDICEDCAHAKGVGIQSPFSISDLLSGLAELDSEVSAYADPVCSCCGLSFKEFRKRGRLGCSECYETFKAPLESLLQTIHKNTRHKGKKFREQPDKNISDTDMKTKLKELKNELKQAIEKEEYEYAADLRDRIKDIENALKTGKK
ncbi:MAG: UvrB/UvrC motif-containing protein [Candidatus Auribacterota bacterium]|jgi:protein arginine kinase activator